MKLIVDFLTTADIYGMLVRKCPTILIPLVHPEASDAAMSRRFSICQRREELRAASRERRESRQQPRQPGKAAAAAAKQSA